MTLPVWVGLLTGSPTHVAGVAAAQLLPGFLVGPLAGVLVDRWSPRRTMLVCDVLRLLLMLSLVLSPRPAVVPWIYAVSFAVACVAQFFVPAKSVLVVTIVAPAIIPRAQALSQAAQSAALIVGPALGAAILVALGPRRGVALDALSFGASALALVFVRSVPSERPAVVAPRGTARTALHGLGRDLAAGVHLALGHRGLRTLLLAQAVVALVGNLWFALDLFFVARSLHLPKEAVGVLWAASGLGGLIGSTVLAIRAERLQQRWVLVWGLGIRAVALVGYAATTNLVWALPAAFCAGLGDGLLLVAMGSLTLRWTPASALGRVTALLETTGQAASLGALALLGALQARLTPAQILTLCGLGLILTCLTVWLRLSGTPLRDESAVRE